MAKKVTMEFIANQLGITKNTVSLALRNMPGVSEKTRNEILRTAEKYGYKYKKSNTKNNTGDSKTESICLMLSNDTRNSVGFFSFIQYGIESEGKRNGLNTILYCFDDNKEFQPPVCIRDGIISGIITLGRISRKTVNSIIDLNLPLVIIDDFFDDIRASYILTDNLSGGYIATEYLIKSGHRDIGFFGDVFASPSFFDRYMGYLKAHVQYNIPINNSFSIIDKNMSTLLHDSVDKIVDELKKIPQLPTAMFCCNDLEAISLYKAFSAMGISVPDDISIIGFDDIESSKSVSPELTTMHIYKEAMGERAVKKLIDRMNGHEYIEEKILLPVSLVERQSVKQIG
ncbi:LacI family DNA-binding transcriptional regulator [Acetivibrio mesophilus]|uniref:LacI family DNA-binding transcriptional regulator n=1 Tax=Acetivibrio mesophilus TaxID=2487273 RepID=A0A4Q0I1L8_9FIRM|nr:LacI family DNA-binding transcriptional regulator [Acetivibrio mesophilus]ODM27240.1 LacI family transcriptional regulator [Clostridium sp. Bc-iso-3]RXE58063.1 LacI family DNA-binding transcriptional regulator [Acetivibrio mesophilus]